MPRISPIGSATTFTPPGTNTLLPRPTVIPTPSLHTCRLALQRVHARGDNRGHSVRPAMTRRKQLKPTANNNNDSMDVHENVIDVKREPVDGEEDKQEEDVIDAELEAQVSELSSSTNVETNNTNGDTKVTSDQVSDSVLSPRPNVVSRKLRNFAVFFQK